jgi:hypothetical protein
MSSTNLSSSLPSLLTVVRDISDQALNLTGHQIQQLIGLVGRQIFNHLRRAFKARASGMDVVERRFPL